METGFISHHDDNFDFNYIDEILTKEEENKNVEIIEKNIIDSFNNNSQSNNLIETSEDVIKKRSIIKLAGEIIKCNKCGFNNQNRNPVGGISNPSGKIFVISDYPNQIDEKNNSILSGEVGDFFKKWMDSIQINFNDLFITTLIKCNIDGKNIDQKNFKNIIENCNNYLDRQINIIKPVMIFVLGEIVLSSMFKKHVPIKENHGQFFTYNSIPLIATYNPKEVLKNSLLKKDVWNDLKILKKFYDGKITNG